MTGLVTWLEERAEDAAELADDAWDATTEAASDAWDGATDAVSDAWDAAASVPRAISDAHGGIVRWVINLVDLRDAAGHFEKAAGDFIEIRSRLVTVPNAGLPPQLEGMVAGEVRAMGSQLEAFAEFLRYAADDLRHRADTADGGLLTSFTTPWSFQSGGQKAWTVVDVATTIVPVGLIAKGAVKGGQLLLRTVRVVKTFRALDRYDRVLDAVRVLDKLGKPGRWAKAKWLEDWDELATKAAREGLVGDELFNYTTRETLNAIRKKGLSSGRYLTPDGNMSPLQAHIDLALPGPARRDAIIRVNIEAMKRDGYRLPSLRRIKRDFGMPGGGLEVRIPYRVPRRYVTVVKGDTL